MEGNVLSLSMVSATGPGSEGGVTSWVDGKQAKRQIKREISLFGTMWAQSNCAFDKQKQVVIQHDFHFQYLSLTQFVVGPGLLFSFLKLQEKC